MSGVLLTTDSPVERIVILFQGENDMFMRDKWLIGLLHSTITYHSFPERV